MSPRCRSCDPVPSQLRAVADLLERRWTLGTIQGEGPLEASDRVEPGDEGSEDLYQDELDEGRRQQLRDDLAALERAEARLKDGTYHRANFKFSK